MSRLIVKQPDGTYASWSDDIEDFVFRDVDKKEYAVTRAMEQYERTREEVLNQFSHLDELEKENPNIYKEHGYCMDFAECIEVIQAREWAREKLEKEGE